MSSSNIQPQGKAASVRMHRKTLVFFQPQSVHVPVRALASTRD